MSGQRLEPDEGRFFSDYSVAQDFHNSLPDPHRWRIQTLTSGGYLLVPIPRNEKA